MHAANYVIRALASLITRLGVWEIMENASKDVELGYMRQPPGGGGEYSRLDQDDPANLPPPPPFGYNPAPNTFPQPPPPSCQQQSSNVSVHELDSQVRTRFPKCRIINVCVSFSLIYTANHM